MKQQLSNLLPGLRRFAFSLTGNMADADDLVQMTLEKALKQEAMSDIELQKWTFRVCRNQWIDEYRSHKVRQQATQKPELQQPQINEEQQQLDALTLQKVGRAMQHLNSEQRSVISLVAVQGMAYKDVAQTLDVPVGTVMSRLARARTQLAALLGLSSEGATQ